MKKRLLSLFLAGAAVLLIGGSAMAQVAVPVAPPVAPGTFSLQVQAMDSNAAGQGTWVAPFVSNMEAWFAENFGYRPSAPTTVLLFSNDQDFRSAIPQFRGTVPGQGLSLTLGEPALFLPAVQPSGTIQSGQNVILVDMDTIAAANEFNQANAEAADILNKINGTSEPVNVSSTGSTSDQLSPTDWQNIIEQSIVRQYAMLMVQDAAGSSGPMWFRQGLVEAIVSSFTPGAPIDFAMTEAVRGAFSSGTLPTLGELQSDQTWDQMVGTGGITAAAAQGTAEMAVSDILTHIGGVRTLSLLTDTHAGQDFLFLLQHTAGFSLEGLNSDFQSKITAP